MVYYAVAKGHNIGIYNFWNDCKEQVLGYKGGVYKNLIMKGCRRIYIKYCFL